MNPVCVLGAPRSGTSLAARVLNLLGVELGPEQTMLSPDALNPRGYWEQHEIVELNGEILTALGGAWWRPPPRPPGWEATPAMAPFRARIMELVDSCFRGWRWGFKDPRTTLTLPLWRSAVGELDHVICMRNPLEVLALADDGLPADANPIGIWLHYCCEALRQTAGRRRTFVFYEGWSEDPLQISRDLAAFVNAELDGTALRRVASTFEPALHRHRSSERELAECDDVPPQARTLHRLVRELAAAEQRGETASAQRLQLAASDLDRSAEVGGSG